MADSVFKNIRICGLAGAVPIQEKKIRNFTEKFGKENIEQYIQLTGVESLRISVRQQTASDLGYAAAKAVLEKFNIDRSQIGAVINVTQTPDYVQPSTAFVFLHRLNLSSDCIAFDVNLGCTGFVYGIHICASLLSNSQSRYALLITGDSEKLPDFLSRENPDTSNVLMHGDACTALLLEKTDNPDYTIRTDLHSDGSGYRTILRGGMCRSCDADRKLTRWSDGIDRSITDPYMDGMGVFSFSTRKAPEAVSSFMKSANETCDDYSTFYFHQANKMIIERIAKKLRIDMNKVPMSISQFGNTSSASIPLTMVTDLGEKQGAELQKVLLCGFGVGLSWGVVSLRIASDCVLPLIETDDYFSEGEIVPF